MRAGPATGLVAQVLLLGLLSATTGLGVPGWIAGVACALTIAVALERGLARRSGERLGPASWVTLTRVTLAVGVAALSVDSLVYDVPAAVIVALASVALALDAVDGRVARRTGTASALGARFDGEADAFLILALSVHVAPQEGAWVLAIGAARYVFALGERRLAWMRRRLPARPWRKPVTATQGIVLTTTAAGVLPRSLTQALLVTALVMLAESFGRDTWWLWRHRRTAPAPAPAGTPPRGPVETGIAAGLTLLALGIVWAALVAPNQPSELDVGAFARLPLELLVVVALAVLLPSAPRSALAAAAGAVLGVLVLVKLLDMGFYLVFDRPFRPVDDLSQAGSAVETLRYAFGRSSADAAAAVAVVLVLALLLIPAAALLRVTRAADRHRHWALPAVAALGVVWVALRVMGVPVASSSAAALAVHEVRAVRAGLQDPAALTRAIALDRFRDVPGRRLLTGLRGKDVLLVFVESYGKVAVQDSSISPRIDAVLDQGGGALRASGFGSRSAFLESPTFGGISWLAHATLQSGVWIDSQRRYDQLVETDRFTLSRAFRRAGWRTVGGLPANDRTWPEGSGFYRFDKVYDSRNVGYRGPRFGYATMPDQYVLAALQRLELARRGRPALFAELDLVSSHVPWTRIPQLVAWDAIGDGSIFDRVPILESSRSALFADAGRARAAYGRSIEYTLGALFSFVQRYGDEDLVLVVLGDHQPATLVTGHGASHEVPVSIIAHDPRVLDRIAGWGWQEGMLPGPGAPVLRMDAFRDRFLSAFGPKAGG